MIKFECWRKKIETEKQKYNVRYEKTKRNKKIKNRK